jgi:hypothetical protein
MSDVFQRSQMPKIDLRKHLKPFYSPSAKSFQVLEIPPLQYLMLDGHGDPNTSVQFQDATQSLYSLSYTMKFHLNKTQGLDYTVMGLEGLWYMPDMARFSMATKAEWDWTLMILQPDFITPDLVEEAKSQAAAKGKAPLASQVRLEQLKEGSCVQILYLGAYDQEVETIARMHAVICDKGYALAGKHHEIYLSDARRVAPEKNRTILRQPIRPN